MVARSVDSDWLGTAENKRIQKFPVRSPSLESNSSSIQGDQRPLAVSSIQRNCSNPGHYRQHQQLLRLVPVRKREAVTGATCSQREAESAKGAHATNRAQPPTDSSRNLRNDTSKPIGLNELQSKAAGCSSAVWMATAVSSSLCRLFDFCFSEGQELVSCNCEKTEFGGFSADEGNRDIGPFSAGKGRKGSEPPSIFRGITVFARSSNWVVKAAPLGLPTCDGIRYTIFPSFGTFCRLLDFRGFLFLRCILKAAYSSGWAAFMCLPMLWDEFSFCERYTFPQPVTLQHFNSIIRIHSGFQKKFTQLTSTFHLQIIGNLSFGDPEQRQTRSAGAAHREWLHETSSTVAEAAMTELHAPRQGQELQHLSVRSLLLAAHMEHSHRGRAPPGTATPLTAPVPANNHLVQKSSCLQRNHQWPDSRKHIKLYSKLVKNSYSSAIMNRNFKGKGVRSTMKCTIEFSQYPWFHKNCSSVPECAHRHNSRLQVENLHQSHLASR
ncbi:hypothetical protein EK904_000059 [Melospiza melodia maxima]|nr:hypothetical protein EK904_000059 [Melospiza melodia maxima]